MSYKPSRCPDCGENVQKCCCQAWAKYTKDAKKPLTPFQTSAIELLEILYED